jgi:cellulose synthase/poly-beta-1,6-N-acetylglucosamine synthase-like glycosyltransferase
LITGFRRIKNRDTGFQPKVSVVVAARNEEHNLKNCLTSLLLQTYPKNLTQIVVVDDRSTDDTPNILKQFNSKHDVLTIRISAAQNEISPKKVALNEGIAHANGELIFTTDADCTPPQDWLTQTVPLFKENVGLVIGPAPFTEENNLGNRLLCLDNFATAFVAAGAAGWNIGVTCTGRNLAYRKSVFEQVHGFKKISHSLSGDDDLFLQTVKKQTNWKINYSLSANTSVPSSTPKSLPEYIAQRRRHVSASKHYSKPIQAAYLFYNLANSVLFGFLILSLFLQKYLFIAVFLFGTKLSVDFLSLYVVTKQFGKQHLLYFFPLWEIFFLLNQAIISPWGLIGKIRWKE